jgi:hypothetical protein
VVSLNLILHSYIIKNGEKLTCLMGTQMRPWDESITRIHNQVFIHTFVTWSCSNLVHTTSASNFGQNHCLVSRSVVHWNKACYDGIAKKSETKFFSLCLRAISKLPRMPSDRSVLLTLYANRTKRLGPNRQKAHKIPERVKIGKLLLNGIIWMKTF